MGHNKSNVANATTSTKNDFSSRRIYTSRMEKISIKGELGILMDWQLIEGFMIDMFRIWIIKEVLVKLKILEYLLMYKV